MEEFVIKTKIESSYKKHKLFWGSSLAIIGALAIVVSALYLPTDLLPNWGLFIFFAGLFAIRQGLTPYKKINKLEVFPHELHFSKKTLIYRKESKNIFSLPVDAIGSIQFYKDKKIYGLQLFLKIPFSEKIVIHNPDFPMKKFHKHSNRKYSCDFFFPYFPASALTTLPPSVKKTEKSEKDFDLKGLDSNQG